MRTLPEKYLSEVPVSKETYEIDLAVLDRYQSFSAELLRLALLGLAGYGFLIVNVVLKAPGASGSLTSIAAYSIRYALAVGAVSLAASAMCALGHRYFSTDALTHHVRRLRLRKRAAELPDASSARKDLEEITRRESESLEGDLNRCRWLLVWSSVFLLVGALGVASSFALTLFAGSPQP